MSTTHGNNADGTPITDELVQALLADTAERGYDVEEIRRRRGGRPPDGFGRIVRGVRQLDPEVKRDSSLHVAEQGITVSEAIRRAIGQYLRAG